MTRFKSQGFHNTFRNARKGFRLVLKSEINIRIHIVIAILVLTGGNRNNKIQKQENVKESEVKIS